MKRYVSQTATEKKRERTIPTVRNGAFDSEVMLSFEPKMRRIAAVKRKLGTMPAELKRYPTELYCVLRLYSGASSGSIAVCGTAMTVYAVL